MILSRKELNRLFAAARNPKHRVVLRLIYGSGLRRKELVNLRINEIETDNGKIASALTKARAPKTAIQC